MALLLCGDWSLLGAARSGELLRTPPSSTAPGTRRPGLSPSSSSSSSPASRSLLLPSSSPAATGSSPWLTRSRRRGVCRGATAGVSEGRGARWTLVKRGLMKQSAPLLWQHSSSEGLRVSNRGRAPGLAAKVTRLWAGGGGLSGGAVSGEDQETVRLFPKQSSESQKPVGGGGEQQEMNNNCE